MVEKFKTLLLSVSDEQEGKGMLAQLPISKFEYATNDSCHPVVNFLKVFSKDVRAVEW